ncbi:hypothetical protein D3C76_920310 [compost metagenome]
MIGLKGLGKQAAAVEGVLAQHALAPTVDGRHRRFVHPLCGHVQAVGARRPQRRLIVIAQLLEQGIGFAQLTTEVARGFCQAGADAFTQLLGSGVGEGHHQDLWWQQLAAKALFTAMAEHQAQVQRRDGEGLAGTGTGLDQLAAMQGKGQCQGGWGNTKAHRALSSLPGVCQGASNIGRYRASHQPSNSSLALSAAKSLNCRASAVLSLRSPKVF